MTIAAKSLASSALGQIRSYSRDRSELKQGPTATAVHVLLHTAGVTECICTLCCTRCVSLCRCSFVCVRHSIFYVCVACCDLDVTMRRHYKREREKARGKNNDLSYVPSKRKEEIKSGTSGCGSFVVPYFQPATSTTDRLHYSCIK